MIKSVFMFWKLKLVLTIIFSTPIGLFLSHQEYYGSVGLLFFVLTFISVWIISTFVLEEFKQEIKGVKEKFFIFGIYSTYVKGYICYYQDENDAIKQLEKRSGGLNIDYERSVVTNHKGDVIFSVHPITVVK